MRQLDPKELASLEARFLPDRPGPLVALHAIRTGCGTAFADRWPDPRAILACAAGNFSLCGDPAALSPADLQGRVEGFVDAPREFEALLHEAFPGLHVWRRVIHELRTEPPALAVRSATVRRLGPEDDWRLAGLRTDTAWISKTWGGPAGLAGSRRAFGAFVDGALASVAAPFFVGDRYVDVGVATERACRGRGLSPACAAALARDLVAGGLRPSWTTSPDNAPSLRVAAKLGFAPVRTDVLYVIGEPVPPPARPPDP
jgi:RimJ/RimL family protein N-acetyltransferase